MTTRTSWLPARPSSPTSTALPEERAVLLDRYRLVDVAFKVVGIGSVGTFCAIGLFVTRDNATLLLQLKEAQQSVLAPHAAPSVYADQGQRVVTGQRIMQGQRDIFLDWRQEHCSDQYCYVRRLKDPRAGDRRLRFGRCSTALLRHAVRQHAGARARALGRCGEDRRLHGFRRRIRCGDRRVRHGLCRPGGVRLAAVRRGNQGRASSRRATNDHTGRAG